VAVDSTAAVVVPMAVVVIGKAYSLYTVRARLLQQPGFYIAGSSGGKASIFVSLALTGPQGLVFGYRVAQRRTEPHI
jgi:hypothetical protein